MPSAAMAAGASPRCCFCGVPGSARGVRHGSLERGAQHGRSVLRSSSWRSSSGMGPTACAASTRGTAPVGGLLPLRLTYRPRKDSSAAVAPDCVGPCGATATASCGLAGAGGVRPSPQGVRLRRFVVSPSWVKRSPLQKRVSGTGCPPVRALLGGGGLPPLPDGDLENSAGMLISASANALSHLAQRAEGFIYTVADAAVTAGDGAAGEVVSTTAKNKGWLGGLTTLLEDILKFMETGLSGLHVPYAYGFSIILLTLLVKVATFPLTKKQVESTLAMQNLQPKIKAIQERYKGDQERIQMETARLYKQANVNPLAGCLPTLATFPVWIGLYRALTNVANEGLLTEGFFFVPSLAGPTSLAARNSGAGLGWLFPFVSDDPAQKQSQAILKFLPLMIGYFALSVPSGLSLYWLTNNILTTGQQIWLKKLGGAKPVVGKDGGGILDAGTARRSATPAAAVSSELPAKQSEQERGARFRQLKAEEAARKAAEKAAQEARAASPEDDDEDSVVIPDVAPAAKVPANSGAENTMPRRSKRSKRRRSGSGSA
ncbi:hypothetical protein CBR_g40498 [Chara braunii]|uniref:Membrane insertase YidC/Oxa/ALB C-terminal domain-containing protein n=1 Tax=Chara braunii TaxID=69332 RepID=A0A388LU29_CHABU|nr:hypothetical protein CBR_g40498 [Chara braunii]|eukprot:GBG85771.1 hypothetical protein CBR_g40498 [Chara braunii]